MQLNDNFVFMGDGAKGLTKAFNEVAPDPDLYIVPVFDLPPLNPKDSDKNEEEESDDEIFSNSEGHEDVVKVPSNRLMCHKHVTTAIDKKLPKEYAEEMKSDILIIQQAESREEFDYLNKEFASLWFELEGASVNKFIRYYI